MIRNYLPRVMLDIREDSGLGFTGHVMPFHLGYRRDNLLGHEDLPNWRDYDKRLGHDPTHPLNE